MTSQPAYDPNLRSPPPDGGMIVESARSYSHGWPAGLSRQAGGVVRDSANCCDKTATVVPDNWTRNARAQVGPRPERSRQAADPAQSQAPRPGRVRPTCNAPSRSATTRTMRSADRRWRQPTQVRMGLGPVVMRPPLIGRGGRQRRPGLRVRPAQLMGPAFRPHPRWARLLRSTTVGPKPRHPPRPASKPSGPRRQ